MAKYRIMRGWKDGEIMEPHVVDMVHKDGTVTDREYDDLDRAVNYTITHGGWVERIADKAVWVGRDGWIDRSTGESIRA